MGEKEGVGEQRTGGGGNRTKTRWLTCSNCYNLVMQVLGWDRDQQNVSLD